MKQTSFLTSLRPHLPFVLGLFVLASLFFLPAWQGKVLNQYDARASLAASQEIRQIAKETGRMPIWTDAMFGGMPAYLVAYDFPNTFVGKAVYTAIGAIPNPVNMMFVEMLAAYILLIVLGGSGAPMNRWLAALGAIAYGFGTYNIQIIEAGHTSKVFAMAFAPGILAGTILALRGKYWAGGSLTAFFLCLELGANHIQITYYLFMALAIYVGVEAYGLIKAGKSRQLMLGLATLVGAGLLAAGSYGGRLLVMNEYTKETIRGRSDLTAKTTAANAKAAGQATPAQDGLDMVYASQYSYNISETLTLLIPNAYGGASVGGYSTDSDLYKAMTNRGVDPALAKQLVEQATPGYWGEQPGVGAPIYAGAILLFLFVLGMLVSTNRIKWSLIAATVLLTMITWGSHFMLLNGPLFDYLPLFNKFRSMTMAFGLVQLLLAIGAVLGIHEITVRKLTFAQIRQPLLISLASTAGLALLMAVAGGAFFSFRSASDSQTLAQYFGEGIELVRALVSDRQSALRSDAFRSVIYILLAAGALWAFVTNKLKASVFYPLLLVLMLADLLLVDRRYITGKNFVSKTATTQEFEPTPADQQILQDKTLSYRVFDNTGNFMSDNRPSYFHKSVGGYHAAKLRRYQELVEYAFPKNSLNVLNMLNAKYIVLPGQQPQSPEQQPSPPVVQQNPDALGNAWFVKTVQVVPDADAEVAALQTLNPRDTAIVDKRFADQLKGLPALLNPAGATIRLTKYDGGDRLTYESNAPTEQVAVFSEIYYRGNTDWQFFVDGKPAPHFRANYVLRAMRVPAGSHKIECRFEPPVVATGNLIDLISNVLLIALIGFALFRAVRSPGEPEPVVAAAEPTPAAEPVVPIASKPDTAKPGKKLKS